MQSPATVDAASGTRSSPETGADSGPSTTIGLLSITDPSVLQALEARGMSFAEMIDGPERRESANGLLAGAPRYGALTKTLERDIDELRRADPNAGVSVAKFSHRLFDTRWLRSPAARFELIAIVNRIDRTGIVGGCGEVRFVYRLAYKVGSGDASIASRLPMTVSFEMNALAGDGASCKSAAERWYPPSTEKEELVSWLLSEKGPLSPAQRRLDSLHRLAVNVQSVRWPSTVRPDLGGHAEYILRAFATDPQKGLIPAPLENTPMPCAFVTTRRSDASCSIGSRATPTFPLSTARPHHSPTNS